MHARPNAAAGQSRITRTSRSDDARTGRFDPLAAPNGQATCAAAAGEGLAGIADFPGRFAATFEEWDTAYVRHGVKHNPNGWGWGRGRQPVIDVSWEDAKTYVAGLARETGKDYRLLSEEEWEYCCRAGTDTPFWWGETILTSQANYDGNQTYGGGSKGEYRERTVPVDSFAPNPWGLYQVHGNVWEWCEDVYGISLMELPEDGKPVLETRRVLRGGSWNSGPVLFRAAARSRNFPEYRNSFVGFRIARTL